MPNMDVLETRLKDVRPLTRYPKDSGTSLKKT
jgi:hypothetical protein